MDRRDKIERERIELDLPVSRRVAVPDTGEGRELPREVYSLLAQANLLRMRGRWEEAVDNCMTALRLAPDSSSAQSLLGDIYENQGCTDDAIQWYHMALDAHPDSPADRLKLDRLLRRRQMPPHAEPASGTAPAPPSASPQVPPLLLPPLLRMRRLRQDPDALLRAGAAAAALLVCLIIVFAYSSAHHRAALASLGLAPDQEVRLKPVVVPASGAAAPPAVPRDAAEQAALDTLRGRADLSAQGIKVDDVQFDPRTSHVTLTVMLASDGAATRAGVLAGALQTAQAVAEASPSAALFTVRCLTPNGSSGSSLTFVGDLPRSALAGSAVAGKDAPPAWADAWWSPEAPAP